MLDIALVGTGGMLPLPNRFLTSLLLRYNGNLFLVDCGEGTQVSLRMLGWGFKQISVICLTHFHADHVAGLPGLLLAIGNAERTEPLVIIGPPGVQQIVESLRIIAPVLPFFIQYYEIDEELNEFYFDNLTISTQAVEHRVPCFAYRFTLERQGKFDAQRAQELEIPRNYWSKLQKGEQVTVNNKTFHPHDVLGEKRRGLKLCYATDLRPSDAVTQFAKNSDLFICEGIYADDDKLDKALLHRHCLFSEAAHMAKMAQVKELWLTHFSPSLLDPENHLAKASNIFPNTVIGKDRMTKTLNFIE